MKGVGGATTGSKLKGVVALRPSAEASQLVQAEERPAKKRPLPVEPYAQRGYLGDGPQQEAPPTAAELIRRPLGTFMAGTAGHEGLGKDTAYMADRIESHWLAMAGSEDKQKQLAKLMPPPAARPKKQRRKHEVLDEDTYVDSLTKIITRDFFPDLPKLRQQVEVMDALEANDLERLRQLQARFSQQRSAERSMQRASSIRSVGATPFDTPGSAYAPTPSRDGGDYDTAGGAGQSADDVTNQKGTGDGAKPVDTGLTLDAFHSKYTSEDNEAFAEILEKDQDKQWEKTKWMHEAAHKYAVKQFLLKNAPQDGGGGDRPAMLEGWDFKARNQLIWNPSSRGRETDVVRGPPKEVVHNNTRLRPPSTATAAVVTNGGPGGQSRMYGEVNERGVDANGRDDHGAAAESVADSPKVGGYGFVATPSMSPGVDESPLMTWGDLGSTPLRLDGDGDLRGPAFTIPDMPSREEVGRELDAKVTRKKQAAAAAKSKRGARRPSSGRSGTVGFSASRRSSVGLSPAAQRLLNSTPGRSRSSGGAMDDLRRSYTSKRPGSSRSTRPSSNSRGHAISSSNVRSSARPPSVEGDRATTGVPSSVTDNLLNI